MLRILLHCFNFTAVFCQGCYLEASEKAKKGGANVYKKIVPDIQT
jgi:hypothetical protein